MDEGMLGMYSMFTGGALQRCAVGALGIMPYITATIIMQLLSAVIPQLSKIVREEGGRAKIIQYGRYLTVVLCLGHGTLMTLGWENPQQLFGPSSREPGAGSEHMVVSDPDHPHADHGNHAPGLAR
jgi:preprotein translocase subunit SecY